MCSCHVPCMAFTISSESIDIVDTRGRVVARWEGSNPSEINGLTLVGLELPSSLTTFVLNAQGASIQTTVPMDAKDVSDAVYSTLHRVRLCAWMRPNRTVTVRMRLSFSTTSCHRDAAPGEPLVGRAVVLDGFHLDGSSHILSRTVTPNHAVGDRAVRTPSLRDHRCKNSDRPRCDGRWRITLALQGRRTTQSLLQLFRTHARTLHELDLTLYAREQNVPPPGSSKRNDVSDVVFSICTGCSGGCGRAL